MTGFDTIVITAADEAQATCFRLQAKAFIGTLARQILVIPDPGGKRVGTLGSTVHVLRRVPRKGRMLICHCGGFSKRLPAYAASGKVFAPVARTEKGVVTLFETIVGNMAKLKLPRTGALVVCGDLAPDFDFASCDFSRPGVTGGAYLDTTARGSRHGVYIPAREKGLSAVKGFLQKPNPAESKRAGAVFGGKVSVDTGILWLDARTCAKLAKSKWNEGDLYSDFTDELLKGFAPFCVNTVRRCTFFHIGSSRELLSLLGKGREWVEGCGVSRAAMRLAGGNIVTNVPADYGKPVVLGKGECLLCLPGGKSGWTEVRYNVADNFKEDGKWESLGMGKLMKQVNYRRLGAFRNEVRTVSADLPREVVVERPLRIDLAGGWSDTPPICNEMGGTVLNAAVTLCGESPVKVRVKRIRAAEVRISSVDLRKRGVLRTMAEIHDHSDPHDWCALVKAALTVTGYKVANGGIEVALSSGLPKGSGMGTSSILGACTVAALDCIAGRKFDIQRVMELTLRLEQEMNTGGGWEDQMGALVPGVKILRTKPGKKQRPEWETVKDTAPFAALLKERGLLYFTGEKRMARNVLRGVIANYKADGEEGMERVAALRDGAERCFKAVKAKNWERFAACVNEYWMLKKAMDPGSTNERIEYIIARMSPWTSAVSIAGAGGGGFMFILAKSAEAKNKIVASLNRRPPVKWAKFYDFDVDEKGLTFHV